MVRKVLILALVILNCLFFKQSWAQLREPSNFGQLLEVNFRNQSVVEKLRTATDQLAFVLQVDQLSADDSRAIYEMESQQRVKIISYDKFLIVGNGIPLEFFTEYIKHPELASNPHFRRSLQVASQLAIPFAFIPLKGMVAAYHPGLNLVIFSNTAAMSTGSLIHEIQHARMSKFLERLSARLEKRNLVIPYEIDGDRFFNEKFAEARGFGGVMSLLDEFEAWRRTATADNLDFKPKSQLIEERVYKVLVDLYDVQVGKEAIREFQDFFKPEDFAGKNVARLILQRVKELNGLNEQQRLDLARQGLEKQSRHMLMNYLRLVYRSSSTDAGVSEAEHEWVRRIALRATDSYVLMAANQMLVTDANRLDSDLKKIMEERERLNQRPEFSGEMLWDMEWVEAKNAKNYSKMDALLVDAMKTGLLNHIFATNREFVNSIFRDYSPDDLPRFSTSLRNILYVTGAENNILILRSLLFSSKNSAHETFTWTMNVLSQADYNRIPERRMFEVLQYLSEVLPYARLEWGVDPQFRQNINLNEDLVRVLEKVRGLSPAQQALVASLATIMSSIAQNPSRELAFRIYLALKINPILWIAIGGQHSALLNALPLDLRVSLQEAYAKPVVQQSPTAVGGMCKKVYSM